MPAGNAPLEPIEVVLLDLPSMFAELVGEILGGAPDVGAVRNVTASAPRDEMRADVAILGSEHGLPELGRTLLFEGTVRKVITVGGNGLSGYLYELRPHEFPLGELSSETLLSAVREAPAQS